MRLQGKITRWDDDKGFGFITWPGDQSTVFVHIKAFSGTHRRPELGTIVTYEKVEGRNGKTSAEKVRFLDQPQRQIKPVTKYKDNSFAVLFAAIYVCLLFVAAYSNRISWVLLIVYFLASVVTFAAYGWDKSSARKGKWRTSEFRLHVMALMGGWPGAFAAQRILRHKSIKQEFLVGYWTTVFLNVAAVSCLAWIDNGNFTNFLMTL